MTNTKSFVLGVLCAAAAASGAPAAAADTTEELSAGMVGVAASRTSWLLGADTRLGVGVGLGWCPLGDLLVAERLGLDLHVQVLAGREGDGGKRVRALIGLAPWAAGVVGADSSITRVPTPVGILVPELGIALGGEGSSSAYFAWSAPIVIKSRYHIAPTLMWLARGGAARVYMGLSLRAG